MELREGLSYGDVLVVPQRSPVDSRSDVDLTTNLTPDIELAAPVLSAPMDTVTETETAVALDAVGGFGTIHRFVSVDEQAAMVRGATEAGARVGAAVGIDEDYLTRAAAVLDAGADCVVVDVAHGHMERCLDAVERIDDEFDAEIVAGNVVTPAGVEDLAAAGADGVKVGVGPGSHCTTRTVTGAGMPQLTAVDDCAEAAADLDVCIVADGGIRTSGDAVKALVAGADTVMLGSFFAGTDEAPGEAVVVDGQRYKRSRGMSTTAANEARTDKRENSPGADEGVEALTPHTGPLEPRTTEFLWGIRSGLSYCGGHSIAEARADAVFVRVSPSAVEREGAHGVRVDESRGREHDGVTGPAENTASDDSDGEPQRTNGRLAANR
ncbi:guanosine monophosphate reductase [Salinigranum marinum]|uniref:guanosine monophosphate reductase n=1 Tax=Salinigranum marinum TaxID=1515595 RepID=UPI002989B97F|nr:guanosine monophosphate reductase [Salinigranum marinum]